MRIKFDSYLQITAVLVIAVVLILDLIGILSPDRGYSPSENRNLESYPTMTWDHVLSGRYQERYESFVEDQFPFRDGWIFLKTTTDRLAGKKEFNGIYLGKNGYLIQDFTEPNAENEEKMFAAVKGFTEKHPNIRHYAVVAPTAVSVLSDKLPKNAPVGDEDAYLDRVQKNFTDAGVTFVDIRESMKTAAEEKQLYYKTDHHWTTDGAYIAYRAFANAAGLEGKNEKYQRLQVSDSFCGMLAASAGFSTLRTDDIYVYIPKDENLYGVVSYEEEQEKSASFYCTDNLSVRDQYTLFLNGNHALVRITTNAKSQNTLLILKDSYANCFVPFLVGDYAEIILVDPRYYADDPEMLIKSEQVTDILYLYNANTLSQDSNLETVLDIESTENE